MLACPAGCPLNPGFFRTAWRFHISSALSAASFSSCPNDVVNPQVKNRNPINLELMRIGFKPTGFSMDRKKTNYWNKLNVRISNESVSAQIQHWTGRVVCSASSTDSSIRPFLYKGNDNAAVKIVAKVLAQRSLETGVWNVGQFFSEEELQKDKMKLFLATLRDCGLLLSEGDQFKPNYPHRNLSFSRFKTSIKPWEVMDE